MKKIAILLLCTATSLFAQEKKYQSLLWEISGNGLEKKSYLYGSMHVSDKISYHLSDAFFNHLLGADIVAGESDPATWADLTGMMDEDSGGRTDAGFYSQFYQRPLTKDGMTDLFQSSNYSLNGLLSRTNESRREHQEETYLDMFIYRTGQKYNKITTGLEDAKTSVITIMKVDPSTVRPIESNRAALQKVLKNMSYQEALLNYYREKDLDMLDSINVLTVPEHYLKALLYDRNIVMVHSIDSLAQKGSLFAAVGAAHLPGKKGIIEALRKKGYTVTPVFDTYGEKGLEKKQQIEAYFIKPVLKNYTTPDGVVTIPLFPQVMESRNSIESPDLANGGYITVKRTLLADFLKKDNKPFDHRSLDSLFYENIQGRIIEKKFSDVGGMAVYDIKSATKTGNAQRYKYYVTPLEIITVIMSGEGSYVRQFENEVFANISIQLPGGAWAQKTPRRGGFSVQMPAASVTYGDLENHLPEDVWMYGYDKGAYYFVIEKTLGSISLEDTRFELQRMHYEFDAQFDADTTATRFESNPLAFRSVSKAGTKDIRLKSVIDGPKYYLMGTVGGDEDSAEKFFGSFTPAPDVFRSDFRTFTDSIGNYTILIPEKQNERLDFVFNHSGGYQIDPEKINYFSSDSGDTEFLLPSGRTIALNYRMPHRYEPLMSADSVWANIRERYETADDDEDYADEEYDSPPLDENDSYDSQMYGKKGIRGTEWHDLVTRNTQKHSEQKLVGEKITNNPAEGYSRMDYLVVQENSQQAIKTRHYYRNGVTYEISAMVSRDYRNDDPYLEKVFDSFRFFDDAGNTIAALTDNKVALFIQDAKSEHDSIRFSAFASLHNIDIHKKDLKPLMGFIEEFDFKGDESESLYRLYNSIGSFDDPAVIPFLEKQYKKEDVPTRIQFAILQALTNQESKEAYKKIMELMEHDLPLSDQEYMVESLFDSFTIDTENSAVLVPDIFQFYSVREYHDPLLAFSAALLEDGAIKPGKLKSIKKMVLTNARLELKRAKSHKALQDDGEEDYRAVYRDDESTDLTSYVQILYPFRQEKDVKPFFTAIKALGMKDLELELARLDIVNNNSDKETLEPLLNDPETLFTVYNIESLKKENLVKDISDEELAASAVYIFNDMETRDEELALLEKKIVPYNGVQTTFYFFRVTDISEDEDNPEPDRIAAVAFVNHRDGTINTTAHRDAGLREIDDEDKAAKYMAEMIDVVLNEYNNRTHTGTADEALFPYDEYSNMGY